MANKPTIESLNNEELKELESFLDETLDDINWEDERREFFKSTLEEYKKSTILALEKMINDIDKGLSGFGCNECVNYKIFEDFKDTEDNEKRINHLFCPWDSRILFEPEDYEYSQDTCKDFCEIKCMEHASKETQLRILKEFKRRVESGYYDEEYKNQHPFFHLEIERLMNLGEFLQIDKMYQEQLL